MTTGLQLVRGGATSNSSDQEGEFRRGKEKRKNQQKRVLEISVSEPFLLNSNTSSTERICQSAEKTRQMQC